MGSTNGAIVAYETDHGRVELTADIVRRQLVNGNGAVTDQEVGMFLQLCKYQQLNPFLKEAYLIKYGNQDATIITGKDVFVKRAAKNEQFDGMESGLYLQPKNGGEITKRTGAMWLPGEKIVGAWSIVHRKDWTHPVEASVAFAEYVGKRKDGSVNSQWVKMPGTMIIKVAESHALRKAFPSDFQGLYDAAEMSHVEVDERVVTPPQPDQTILNHYIEVLKSESVLTTDELAAAIEYVRSAKTDSGLSARCVALDKRIEQKKRDATAENQEAEEQIVGQQDLIEDDPIIIPEDIF